MKKKVQILLPLVLICYLVVSSIAAVHAFPMSVGGTENTQEPSAADGMSGMGPDCHQQQSDSSAKSTTACKIFCAAMANVIASEFIFNLPLGVVSTHEAFSIIKFNELSPLLEPYPPKKLLTISSFSIN